MADDLMSRPDREPVRSERGFSELTNQSKWSAGMIVPTGRGEPYRPRHGSLTRTSARPVEMAPLTGRQVEFALFAPHVPSVALMGSWSRSPLPLRRDAGGTWRRTVLLPEGRHRYRFRLPSRSHFLEGQIVDVTDPFARLVDEANGDVGIIVIAGGRDVTTAYDWRHDDEQLPQDDELILYELHVGEFGVKDGRLGTFETVIGRLDYLRDLGINAVELMPVAAFPTDRSWGYNVRHACAVENAYGTPQDLKRLVDECHARRMRVILDVVFNHTEVESPLTKIDFDYWFRESRADELYFGPKLDFEHVDDTITIDGRSVMPAHKYGLQVAAYWLREYHLDGYRLDATFVLDNFDFVAALRRQSKELASGKPFYVVAEHLPEDPLIAGPDGPADGAWHQRFEHAVVEALVSHGRNASELLSVLQPRNDGYVSPARVVNYVESHDEPTLMQRLTEAGITGEAAFRKSKLAATLLFTVVGNPMLYQGQEFGGSRPRDLEIRPLQWAFLNADYGLHLKEHHAFLARLRRDSPALQSDHFAACHNRNGVIAYRRGCGEAEVIVVANLRDDDRTATVAFPSGAWREATFDYQIDAWDGRLRDSFPASSAKIYRRS
jgi:1,4-alpha-glucan branching enzyme